MPFFVYLVSFIFFPFLASLHSNFCVQGILFLNVIYSKFLQKKACICFLTHCYLQGPSSKNPLAYKWYNAEEVILGKKMKVISYS